MADILIANQAALPALESRWLSQDLRRLRRLKDCVEDLKTIMVPVDSQEMAAFRDLDIQAASLSAELLQSGHIKLLDEPLRSFSGWRKSVVERSAQSDRIMKTALESEGRAIYKRLDKALVKTFDESLSQLNANSERTAWYLDLLSRLAAAEIAAALIAVFLFWTGSGKQMSNTITTFRDSLRSLDSNGTISLPPSDVWNEVRGELSRLSELVKEAGRKENAIFEKTADVICLLDVLGRFIKVSPACKSVWGYEQQELLEKDLLSFIASDDAAGLKEILGSGFSLNNISFESRFRKKNGDWIDLVWSAYWSFKEQGLYCVAHDITARKKEEQLIRTSEERLRCILEALPVAVVMFDNDGRIEFANQQMINMTGLQKEELLCSSLRTILPGVFGQEPIGQVHQKIDEKVVDGVLKRSDGKDLFVQLTLTEIAAESTKKHLLALLDVTERYEIEQTKRRFTALVSHELRTPMASIQLIFVMFNEERFGKLSEKGHHFVNRGLETVDRLIQLINDLLDLEKIRAGRFVLQLKPISARELVESAVDSIAGVAEKQSIGIDCHIEDVLCHADGPRLIQVLVNLLSNALKFSPAGSSIAITAQRSNEGVMFFVEDHGKGIPADKQTEIFETYAQVSIDDGYIGSGLGLPICKSIVEQHAGRIGVDSTLGEGSKFWIVIPEATS